MHFDTAKYQFWMIKVKISSVEILENYFVLEVMHPLGSTLVRDFGKTERHISYKGSNFTSIFKGRDIS